MKNIHPYVRVALVLILGAAIWKLAFFIGESFFAPGVEGYRLDRHVLYAVMAFAITVPTVLVLWKFLDRRPWSELGLTSFRGAWKHFLIGAGIWLVPASVGLALCLSFGWVSIESARPLGEILAFVPLLILLVFLYEAFPEELVFRGYIYANLSEKLRGYWVVLVQAILFTLWGVAIGAAVSLDRIAFFFAAAWVIGSLRMVSGNIWVSIGFHVAFQTVAQLLLNESRGFFLIENVGTLQLVALGIVPFACAELLARWIYGRNK